MHTSNGKWGGGNGRGVWVEKHVHIELLKHGTCFEYGKSNKQNVKKTKQKQKPIYFKNAFV